jgi:Nif-specific regulatory protein
MNPRLIAIEGPLKGAIFALDEDEMSIGRESSNRLSLTDLAVSRRHCLIKQEGGHFIALDLGSFNGTFVNGVPIKEQALAHGDRIKIGDSLLLFLLHEGELQPAQTPVQFAEGKLVTNATIRIRQEDALYLQPEKVLASLSPTARVARDLNALLKISAAINSLRDLETLERQLLELIGEVIPAERGAILLNGEHGEEFVSVFGWSRGPDKGRPVQVSRTVTSEVMSEGVAMLCNDVLEREDLAGAESLIAPRIQSLLAVPLVAYEKRLGVIYLDTSDPLVCFDEDHLQLLTSIAGLAAVAVENIRHLEWLESENQRLVAEINLEHNMIGESARMREVYQFLAKVAPTDSTVLLRGESGTGKELAARAIHSNSPRAAKPFVAINCAALTETLLESELFGHEKGAFTGAIVQKKGKLEVADGGTVFLDEMGEMTPALQAKLLRVLQEQEFERVGGTRTIKVDIRLIAATNRDLEEAIKQGRFRQDLYYRLNVLMLEMPPLRERREDIPLLAGYFAAKYGRKCKRQVRGLSAETRACLMDYDWPGNVRELENAIERAVVLGTSDLILPEDLPDVVLESEPQAGAALTKYHEAIKETKKQLIIKAVEQAGGNYTEAARLLGVQANYLHRLIRNLNLKAALKKSGVRSPESEV